MPKVRIKLFALYRELAGQKEVELNLPDGATVKDMLTELEETFPKLRGKFTTERQGDRSYILMKGGRWPNLEDRLEDGDEFSLFPPVGGGREGQAMPASSSDQGRVVQIIPP